MPPKKSRKKISSQALVETGTAEKRGKKQLRLAVDNWPILLEWEGKTRPAGSIERCGEFTLVHFDFPGGSPGEYHLSVQQPFIDIYRSWIGKFHAWQGLELTSIALNFNFSTAANRSMPVICNYSRAGENRGVVGMLNQVPQTQVNQRPVFDEAPLRILQVKFSRARNTGNFRETVVIYRGKLHFAEAVRRWMRFCRQRQGIEILPAPAWAREPVWCSWYAHLYILTQGDVERQIPYLKKSGIRTVLIDASWFQQKNKDRGCQLDAGEYVLNKSFFPDFRGLSHRLHDQGFKIMLWCAPLFMGKLAPNRNAMARYCTWDGKERSSILCPFCAESKAHARGVMERLMRDYELDGMKLDFMDAGMKDDITMPCLDPKHDHGDGNYGAAMIEFMRALREGILKVKPDAAIEYRISYSTLATLPFANCHRGNDSPFDADYMRRENIFLRLFCDYPAAVWNDYAYWHAREKPENISLMLGSQIFSGGVPTLAVNVKQCGENQRRIISRWMKFYSLHLDSLARAGMTVHSADSCYSVTSLQNLGKREAFVLLSGQNIPARISLKPQICDVWVLNASAEKKGILTLTAGKSSARAKISGLGPSHVVL